MLRGSHTVDRATTFLTEFSRRRYHSPRRAETMEQVSFGMSKYSSDSEAASSAAERRPRSYPAIGVVSQAYSRGASIRPVDHTARLLPSLLPRSPSGM